MCALYDEDFRIYVLQYFHIIVLEGYYKKNKKDATEMKQK